jgi:hypothetical protein
MTTGRLCSATETTRFWGEFNASERDDVLRARARHRASGLMAVSVMSDQELSRRGLGGEVVDGTDSS